MKKTPNRKFKTEWIKSYPWLKELENGKKCKICDLNITGSQFHIQRHAESEGHKKNESDAKGLPKIDNFIAKTTSVDSVSNKAKDLEIMLTLFVAEHNLPFTILDHLNYVLKNGITDSNIVKSLIINRNKGTKIVKDCIGPSNSKQVINLCQQQYYSIIVDESTDRSVSKNLAILIRIYDGVCADRFLTLIHVSDGTAESIFNAIMNVFKENDIPISNLVGFGADNCATMMGRHNGVQALLKQVKTTLYVSGCICHNLNLASSHAAKHIPKTVDDLIRYINSFFCNSSTRRDDLTEFQKFFNSEEHAILKYAPTRWLSRQAAVDRIIEQWDPLTSFFTLSVNESKDKANNTFILKSLNDNTVKLYFLFLSYVLKIINDINIEMQSQDTRVHVIMNRLSVLFRQLARNFLIKKAIEDVCLESVDLNSNHLPTMEIYCGAAVEILIGSKCIPDDEVLSFKHNVMLFYKTFLEYIQKKYDFGDFYLNWFPKFAPDHVLSGETNSIVPLVVKLFPNETEKLEQINSEYRALSEVPELKKFKDLNISQFWKKISMIKNCLDEPLYANVYRIVQGILSIPHSSACVERIFSSQNLIKTNMRNRLHVNTVSSLIQSKDFIKSNSGNCYDKDILKLVTQKNVTNSKITIEELLD